MSDEPNIKKIRADMLIDLLVDIKAQIRDNPEAAIRNIDAIIERLNAIS